MAKAILLSIHPKWAEKIYSGEKTIEWRKTLPKSDESIVYIYETAPVKKITGYFLFYGAFKTDFKGREFDLYKWDEGCVPLDDLKKYQGDSKSIYGWLVSAAVHFSKEKTLSDFGLKRAPQSWQYVEVKE